MDPEDMLLKFNPRSVAFLSLLGLESPPILRSLTHRKAIGFHMVLTDHFAGLTNAIVLR